MWMVLGVVVAAAPVKSGVDGGLSMAEVAEVLAFRSPDVAGCFKPGKRPAVSYQFEISPLGEVSLSSLLDERGVEPADITCVGRQVKATRFPAVDAGTTVTWVFTDRVSDAGIAEGERVLVAPETLAPLDALASRCAARHGNPGKGHVGVVLDVGRSGAVLSASLLEAAPLLAGSKLAECLVDVSRSARLPAARQRRWAEAWWLVAWTEKGAKLLFDPQRPARELIIPQSATDLRPGALDRAVIRRVIKDHEPRVRRCYESHLSRKPEREAGKLQLHWVIGPHGRVETVRVGVDALKSAELVECVEHVVRGMEFPRPIGGGHVSVSFPWIFKVAGSDDRRQLDVEEDDTSEDEGT